MESLPPGAVVQQHVEAAGDSNDELVAALQRVPGAQGASGHVIEVEDPLNGEWNVTLRLDEGKVAALVVDLWQIDQMTILDGHGGSLSNATEQRSGARRYPVPRHVRPSSP